jgi:predicted DsbA family dithiol-disulfide isomerase
VAEVRLKKVKAEFGEDLCLMWRSFLLRPEPDPNRTLEKFKEYTQSWTRPARMEPETVFRPWVGEEGPPSHSFPPHQAAKIAARIGPEAFEKIHERLLSAYFSENRDITSRQVLEELWADVGLSAVALDDLDDPEITRQIMSEHLESLRCGVSGVPAIRLEQVEGVLVGAQDLEVYRRLVQKVLTDL